MEFIQNRVEPWIRDQRAKLLGLKASWGPLQWRMKWPWASHREHKMRIQEEYHRLRNLCHALKADSVSDLQDLLCCMVLSECVYKRPAAEMIRAVNKFKADFGGQVVALERVQPSSDHVPHRYLLAEAGDTLFASFIGTKQYKDVIADANILQGAIFHDDAVEEFGTHALTEPDRDENQNGKDYMWNPLQSRSKQQKSKYKPAAHRNAQRMKAMLDKLYMVLVLRGLNSDFEHVLDQILTGQEIPSTDNLITWLLSVPILKRDGNLLKTIESFAMVSNRGRGGRGNC
ncbi:hypothetical protein CR513_40140 [Mucuna pruriens]|uniref:Uncharacterized protein n=1 Tax=Mucuna pruriens TaxID=157652 RepID=A0A371FMB0_MUCPR|nr:hypothetical protein CR513_40140 [Mucuna pruriens]